MSGRGVFENATVSDVTAPCRRSSDDGCGSRRYSCGLGDLIAGRGHPERAVSGAPHHCCAQRHWCREANVSGCPMFTHVATSTCCRSNSKIGSCDVDSIIPPTPLRATTLRTMVSLPRSPTTSVAVALMHSSSSSGPGIAWITHRGSRRKSCPFGEDRGIAANSPPPARIGQNGWSRGAPSPRTVAR